MRLVNEPPQEPRACPWCPWMRVSCFRLAAGAANRRCAMRDTSTAALILKLKKNNWLDEDDIVAIQHLPIEIKRVAAHNCFVRDGDRPSESCLIIDGFAFRSKFTPDGKRQILSIHIPGEIPDLQSLHRMSWTMT